MVRRYLVEENIEIPGDVHVSLDGRAVSVSGPLGRLERDFSYAPIDIELDGNKVTVGIKWPDKKGAAMVGTVRSHIRNMVKGVQKGYTYKLKTVFAHFPVSVKVEGNKVVIENFGGERRPRSVFVDEKVKVNVEGDDIIVKGLDLEKVSQAASIIEHATRIKKKDPRVFLDGIYVYEKLEGM
ncbi:50S ribosomal protein L6 [Candidatus Bathyarchaeota archaeon]|nr:50S ribosomal protein L6 [Candidatus Bathyarchaeota archaeon]